MVLGNAKAKLSRDSEVEVERWMAPFYTQKVLYRNRN